jgi:hypothetical protein
MHNYYVVKVPDDKIEWVADMLRYDSCFDVERTKDGWRCSLLSFTKARWASFGFVPELVYAGSVPPDLEKEAYEKAASFIKGVRFAQQVLGKPLVEGQIH